MRMPKASSGGALKLAKPRLYRGTQPGLTAPAVKKGNINILQHYSLAVCWAGHTRHLLYGIGGCNPPYSLAGVVSRVLKNVARMASCKAHGAERPRHIKWIGEGASTAQRRRWPPHNQ